MTIPASSARHARDAYIPLTRIGRCHDDLQGAPPTSATRTPTHCRCASRCSGCIGGRRAFAGPVSTVRCFEDNSRVKEAVESPGEGRVLVVDGGGSRRRALFGGNLGRRR